MKIADTITVTVAGDTITLHPALRHAMRLERREGSFATLVQEITDGSLTVACDLIGDHVSMSAHMRDAVFNVLPDLRDALLAYVMACAGIDPDDAPAEGKAKGKPVSFSEHLSGLYRIGTGWLGWTPAQTLDSTPAEIMEAYRGRLDLLRSIFGGSDQDRPDTSTMTLDDKMKTTFASLKTVKVKRRKP